MLKYSTFDFFRSLLMPFSNFMRRRRQRKFEKIVQPYPGMRVLDLGGQPHIWDFVSAPLKITCLNLPGIADVEHQSHHDIEYVTGDACKMPEIEPGQFDFVFSNSVIEHVGDETKRRQFAQEVQRVCPSYWVQTPSILFPIEAHCGMPFWWFYPRAIRSHLMSRWERKLPSWTEMVRTTSIVRAKELKSLFPTGTLRVEWLVFPKSLTMYSLAGFQRKYTQHLPFGKTGVSPRADKPAVATK
ncbi:MAG: methyltransferase domain-containing protein [Planctomycetales bacterium]|nr:methyltransferase domain-containing protein [Planctomycetales bacterium]